MTKKHLMSVVVMAVLSLGFLAKSAWSQPFIYTAETTGQIHLFNLGTMQNEPGYDRQINYPGGEVDAGGLQMDRIYDLAQDPTTGTYYALVVRDLPGTGSCTLNRAIVRLDVTTGAATLVGFTAHADPTDNSDADSFAGDGRVINNIEFNETGQLFGSLGVCAGFGVRAQGNIYTIDKFTGARSAAPVATAPDTTGDFINGSRLIFNNDEDSLYVLRGLDVDEILTMGFDLFIRQLRLEKVDLGTGTYTKLPLTDNNNPLFRHTKGAMYIDDGFGVPRGTAMPGNYLVVDQDEKLAAISNAGVITILGKMPIVAPRRQGVKALAPGPDPATVVPAPVPAKPVVTDVGNLTLLQVLQDPFDLVTTPFDDQGVTMTHIRTEWQIALASDTNFENNPIAITDDVTTDDLTMVTAPAGTLSPTPEFYSVRARHVATTMFLGLLVEVPSPWSDGAFLRVINRGLVTLVREDFEGVTLKPPIQETGGAFGGDTPIWTDVFPTGWTVDNSNMADQLGAVCPEYPGWVIWGLPFWQSAAGQARDQFTLANSSNVAVADSDEADDCGGAGFWSILQSPDIVIPANEQAFLTFDNDYRHYDISVGRLGLLQGGVTTPLIDYGAGTPRNTPVSFDLPMSTSDQTLKVVWEHANKNPDTGLLELANNEWWWAFDNVVVFRTGDPLNAVRRSWEIYD